MSEKTLMNHFQLLFSKLGHRLFRNNQGSAWQGEVHRLKDGSVLIKNPRIVHFGLAKGSGDLIGYTNIKITHAHLNKTIPVFTSIELKSKSGRPTEDQLNWDSMIRQHNGISIITKSPLTADQLLSLVSDQTT